MIKERQAHELEHQARAMAPASMDEQHQRRREAYSAGGLGLESSGTSAMEQGNLASQVRASGARCQEGYCQFSFPCKTKIR